LSTELWPTETKNRLNSSATVLLKTDIPLTDIPLNFYIVYSEEDIEYAWVKFSFELFVTFWGQ